MRGGVRHSASVPHQASRPTAHQTHASRAQNASRPAPRPQHQQSINTQARPQPRGASVTQRMLTGAKDYIQNYQGGQTQFPGMPQGMPRGMGQRRRHHKFSVNAKDIKSLTKIAKLVAMVSKIDHKHRHVTLHRRKRS